MHQEESSSINLVSFNVNILGQEVKRKGVSEKLEKLDCISFLHETFSTKNIETRWKDE